MPANPEEMELAAGVEHENLEGWIPSLASDDEIRSALEKAFDYRGDVTITLKDGSKVEGYVFDRRSDGSTLQHCRVRLFPKDRQEKLAISYTQIARVEFTGRDTAAGKSFETWVKKYHEKNAPAKRIFASSPKGSTDYGRSHSSSVPCPPRFTQPRSSLRR